MTAETPPEGFTPWEGRTGFAVHIGPYFRKATEPGRSALAFFGQEHHGNSFGVIHGGMLSSFMDSVLAGAVARETGISIVTIHLAVDFLAMARKGRWVVGEGRVTRQTRDLAFVEGRAFIGAQDVVHATGIFKVMEPRGRPHPGA